MEEAVEHRADAVFALPRPPRTARLFGEPPGWRADLEQRGIELSEGGADIAVAVPERLDDALRSDARVILVDASRASLGSLRRDGRPVRALLPLPLHGRPGFYLDLGHRRAARHALRRFGVGAPARRRVRNRLAGELARAALLDRVSPVVGAVGDVGGPPAHIAAARELGVPPQTAWAMVVSAGSPVRRNAFLLFEAGAGEPHQVLKFGRVPGATRAFDREERGLAAAHEAGGSVAAWAPRRFGTVEVEGRRAALEQAARGSELQALLRSPAARERKLAALERVVEWLERVARETAAAPQALDDLRERLQGEAVPRYAGLGLHAGLLERLPPLPAVFRHGDLGEDNVFVDGDRCSVIDWEWVQPHGLPLADLAYFGGRVCRILDGATAEHQRFDHFRALMAGRAPSSPVLFGWIRRAARSLEVPCGSVGPLVTAGLLDHARLGWIEREHADRATGRRHDESLPEQALRLWLTEPGLGPEWPAFSAV